MRYFFVALTVAAAITAVIVAAVLLILMFFMFAAFLFTKKNQKPRKSTKNNKREKECGTCCDCCFIYLWPEQMQLVPPSTVEQALQVVVVEEVLPEVEPPTETCCECCFIPLLPEQLQLVSPNMCRECSFMFHFHEQMVPPSTAEEVLQVVAEEEVLPEVEAPTEIVHAAPPAPTQPHQSPPQLRRSSRLAGKPPVDFRPFF